MNPEIVKTNVINMCCLYFISFQYFAHLNDKMKDINIKLPTINIPFREYKLRKIWNNEKLKDFLFLQNSNYNGDKDEKYTERYLVAGDKLEVHYILYNLFVCTYQCSMSFKWFSFRLLHSSFYFRILNDTQFDEKISHRQKH